ncbi:hypothetical protein HOA55_03570 [archaeon]|jgi:hypothetical protein|nr:hypothetical protein [archaeon]MBT3577347.1 hypothetical protein [archaeon]MBT6820409.1 hypothetical protein [archaeon]MBT7025223.1 hypothetical protein [archaeon]MBT7238818.1 hypothetical protein [archaeon]
MAKNEKRVDWNQVIGMIVYWAIFLTATMALFERMHIFPATVPFGVIGWTVLVELPRVVLGYAISLIFFRK